MKKSGDMVGAHDKKMRAAYLTISKSWGLRTLSCIEMNTVNNLNELRSEPVLTQVFNVTLVLTDSSNYIHAEDKDKPACTTDVQQLCVVLYC
jgi:hypothetical protein